MPCWKLFVHRQYKMLTILSISMRSLFMQEFSPIFPCWLLESFTTVSWRTTWPVSQNSRSCCPTLTVNHSYASRMPFLKRLTVSFFAKGNSCVSKEQLPRHWLTLQNVYLSPRSQGYISKWFVGLEGRNFPPVISSFTEPYWPFGRFPCPTRHSSPAQDRSGAIPG